MAASSTDKNRRFPDFIIGGAPKCGTTSVHFILRQHPDIGIPDEEIHYFDMDDPIAHPDFLSFKEGKLSWYDCRLSNQHALAWYANWFAPHTEKPFVGEDSTTYLTSPVAAQRIKALLPDVKLIFVLRDPVSRAYSQYWHLIRSSRSTATFEQALTEHSSIILGSTYEPHLRHFIDIFGKDQVHVAIFEDFLKDKQSFTNAITEYIGAPEMAVDDNKSWFNKSFYPSHPRLKNLINRIGKHIVRGRYDNHLSADTSARAKRHAKLHYRWFRYINPIFLTAERPPPMQPETKAYLTQHLSARNAGLSDLIGRDLSKIWPGFEG